MVFSTLSTARLTPKQNPASFATTTSPILFVLGVYSICFIIRKQFVLIDSSAPERRVARELYNFRKCDFRGVLILVRAAPHKPELIKRDRFSYIYSNRS